MSQQRPVSQPTTRSMSRAAHQREQQEAQYPPLGDQSNQNLPAMPGAMPPGNTTLQHPVPRRDTTLVSTTPIIFGPAPAKEEESLDKIEGMTRVIHQQGGQLPVLDWLTSPNPPNPTGSTQIPGTLSPTKPNPVQVIAVTLRDGLGNLKREMLTEIQRNATAIKQCSDSLQTQELRVQQALEASKGAHGNAYLAFKKTEIIETDAKALAKSVGEIGAYMSSLNDMAKAMKEATRLISEILTATKKQETNIDHIEEVVIALDQRTTNWEKEEREEKEKRATNPKQETRFATPGSSRAASPGPFKGKPSWRESTANPEGARPLGDKEGIEDPSFMNQTTNAGNPIPKEARAKKPEPFDGKKGKGAEAFLIKMNIDFEDHDEGTFNDNRKISTTLMNMANGDASKWAEPLLQKISEKGTHEFLGSWAIFKKAFLGAFSDPVKKDKAIRALHRLTQTTSALDYSTQFRILIQEVDWNENALIDKFCEGLKPEVKQELLRLTMFTETDKASLEDWITEACKSDDLIYANRKLNSKEALGSYQASGSQNKPYQGSKLLTNQTTGNQGRTNTVKIPDEEKQHRRRENLCIKCGKSGHVMKDCRGQWTYNSTPKTQGKAGTLKEEEGEEESESEN